jgi:hypothetical protein
MSDRERDPRRLRELERDVAEENPDDTTRREALELELMDEGRSEDGERIDMEEDLGPGQETPG